MNSFNAGCANCSSHREGFTPVSQSSTAISLVSCQPGVTRCTSFPSSSKQNKKNKCGYQCRQKCQNFCAAVGQTEGSVALRASIRHKISIRVATSACTPINLKGWAIFSANAAISALDAAK